MKNTIYLAGVLALALGMSACSKKDDSKKDADKAAAEMFNKPVAIDPGTYVSAIDCGDKAKNEKLPKLSMIFKFKEDGTYTENVVNLDKACTEDCDFTVEGTYKATESTFTFNQTKVTSSDGTKVVQANETKVFSVLGYSSYLPGDMGSKGQIILQDNETDNACGGKLLWAMVKN